MNSPCYPRPGFFGYKLMPFLVVVGALSLYAPLYAQNPATLSAAYGRGVHAYFASDTVQAEQLFTDVIQAGSNDPRPYYFRAMLRLRAGRQAEAENDMRLGASLEARNPGEQHAISRSLQRVQGSGRRMLESFRRQARLDRVQQGQQRTLRRYEQLEQRGPAVLHSPAPLPLEQPVQPPKGFDLLDEPAHASAPASTAPELAAPVQPSPTGSATKQGSDTKGEETDVFGEPLSATPANEPTKETAPASDEDPFADEAEASTSESSDADPFAEDEDSFADETAEQGTESTDASSSEAEEDPFGESEASEQEEEDDPFGDSSEKSASDEEDPFGESSDEQGDSSEGETESDDEDDPFGDF